MTKTHGLGDHFSVHGYDLSGDIGSLGTIHGGPAAMDMTGINKSAPERFGGKRDGGIDFNAWHNDAAVPPVGAHSRLSLLPVTDVIYTYHHGNVIGGVAASMVGKQIDYAGTRAADGAYSYAVPTLGNGFALEWGNQLTPWQRTDTTATNGASFDQGTASPGAFGLSAYLHVYAFTGTSVTIKIQESSDNGAGDAFADVVGGAFTLVNGITSERIQTAAINVERYLRVVTTGTFSNVVFTVMAKRFEVATVF